MCRHKWDKEVTHENSQTNKKTKKGKRSTENDKVQNDECEFYDVCEIHKKKRKQKF